jgi:5'-3' exonuclease
MKYLIDADIVAFKAAAAVEQAVEWGDGLWTLHAWEHEGIDYCQSYLNNVLANLGDGELKLFLSDKHNWRKDILPSYKASRKSSRKPLILAALKQYMVNEWAAVSVSYLEADDLLGITATSEPDCVIVSEDKDLLTIPSLIYNPAKDVKPKRLSEFSAFYNHMFQTLVGDRTDGYDGCPTIGPVKAQRILNEAETKADLWDAVVATYKKNKLGQKAALQQAQVAYICQASNFNTKTGKVTPWLPSSMKQ